MKLSDQQFIFAIDVERNDPIAASGTANVFNAIVVKVYNATSGRIVDEFGLRLSEKWFSGNFAQTIFPSLKDMSIIAGDTPDLLYREFWLFWLKWHEKGACVWADTALLESCFFKEVMLILNASFSEGPWRVDDVRVLMLAAGYDADSIKSIEFAGLDGKVNRHDPRADCEIVIECWKRCVREMKK